MNIIPVGGIINERQADTMKETGISCEQAHGCVQCHKKKQRDGKEYRELRNRLKRIEGQVRGLERMLEEDAYCIDILTQVSAVNAALHAFNKKLLSAHIQSCVADNIRQGNDEVIDELVQVLPKLMK